jgi:hypothetical protein
MAFIIIEAGRLAERIQLCPRVNASKRLFNHMSLEYVRVEATHLTRRNAADTFECRFEPPEAGRPPGVGAAKVVTLAHTRSAGEQSPFMYNVGGDRFAKPRDDICFLETQQLTGCWVSLR